MMVGRFEQLEALLESLIDLPPKERSARLDADCSDPDLRAEVEDLLRHLDAERQSPDFLRAVTEIMAPAPDTGVDPHTAPTATTEIGPYRIVRRLGSGGMGTVYLAEHRHLKKQVALKLLPASAMTSSELISRFHREMQSVGKLDHDNVVRASDAGEADGSCFLVMELVSGPNLEELVGQQGPLTVADACEIVRQAADGIAHAHSQGIVHRDIKPSNLMITAQGRVKVVDFGLALLRDAAATALTGSGRMMGTVDYMAPEQATHNFPVDTRTDVYSLGATLYKLLTGSAPFEEDEQQSAARTLLSLAGSQALPIGERRTDLPASLADLVDRMLAPVPDHRPQSASEVCESLAAFADAHQLPELVHGSAAQSVSSAAITPAQDVRKARLRRSIIGTVISVVLLIAALGWFLNEDDRASSTKTATVPQSSAQSASASLDRIQPQTRTVAAWPYLRCQTTEPANQLGPLIENMYQLCEQLSLSPADDAVTLAYIDGPWESETWSTAATKIEIRIRLDQEPQFSNAQVREAGSALGLQQAAIREPVGEEAWIMKPAGVSYSDSMTLWTALEEYTAEQHTSTSFTAPLERFSYEAWSSDADYTSLQTELIIPFD